MINILNSKRNVVILNRRHNSTTRVLHVSFSGNMQSNIILNHDCACKSYRGMECDLNGFQSIRYVNGHVDILYSYDLSFAVQYNCMIIIFRYSNTAHVIGDNLLLAGGVNAIDTCCYTVSIINLITATWSLHSLPVSSWFMLYNQWLLILCIEIFLFYNVSLHPTIYPVSRGISIPSFSSSESIYFFIFLLL